LIAAIRCELRLECDWVYITLWELMVPEEVRRRDLTVRRTPDFLPASGFRVSIAKL
jgi:hypothetical protein